MSVDAAGVGAVAFGGVFLYAGIKGISVGAALTAIVRGTSPATVPVTQAITATSPAAGTAAAAGAPSAVPSAAGSSSPQQALANAAAPFGWSTGAQWQALQSIEMAEAGFNPLAQNPSGAFGLAQALGHGQGAATAGSITNEYGGYGVSAAVAQAANSGDAEAQAIWMVSYISVKYGTPAAAWAFHLANGYY